MTESECKSLQLAPISIDEIEPRLYLSNLLAAQSDETLRKYKISHILSLGKIALMQDVLSSRGLKSMFIDILDMHQEDILSHLDKAFDFIEDGLDKGAVLVHCVFGISRSATIVAAYIMKKYNLNVTDAISKVKEKRSIICPSAGFKYQLGLYYEMGCTVDRNNPTYKTFRLSIFNHQVSKGRVWPIDFQDFIQPDPALLDNNPELDCYKCKQCNRILAYENNILPHKDPNTNEICRKLYFIEPLGWMYHFNWLETPKSKLCCPRCKFKVGSSRFGVQVKYCCGITLGPSLYLTPSKIHCQKVIKDIAVIHPSIAK